ncbi:hypothetical protein WMY93_018910 [Mugilogobius chulae]|uniref:Thrombospondin-like N-terminal domain-containing protein n=1 Tax=Mugilogobius chulae TaxID=88201 RepID=A0AAW0NS51_9GOBI
MTVVGVLMDVPVASGGRLIPWGPPVEWSTGEFRVSESKGVKRVDGSKPETVAYRINPSIHLRKTTSEIYPDGLPADYSVIATFKVPKHTAKKSWSLWQVSDSQGRDQVGLRFHPGTRSLDFFYTSPHGSQMLRTFSGVKKLFDGAWHKLALSVKGGQAKLLIDCEEVSVEPIHEDRPVIQKGYTSIAKRAAEDLSVSVDLQQMEVSCDPEKAYTEGCCELCGGYAEIGLTAGGASCKCMHGQPGIQGPPGPKGHRGLPGESGDRGRLGNWGIRGATGDYGNIGEPGQKGEQGIKGEKGMRGLWGQVGDRGPKGLKGLKGAAGFKGVRGPPGAIGETGKQGEVGAKGEKGFEGIPGYQGVKGEKGTKGVVGQPGPRGKQGIVGDPGERGTAGQKGKPGIQGPVGRLGGMGQKGIIGDPGLPGRDGDPGVEAYQGPQGNIGKLGKVGSKGEKGVQGPPGEMGPQGQTGPTGYKGSAGKPGRPGFIGPPGPVGDTGIQGIEGVKGGQGARGKRGPAGPPGQTGPGGVKGVRGESGPDGFRGPPGPPGPSLPAQRVIEVCKRVILEQMSTFANSVKRTCAAVCPLYGDVPMGAPGPPGPTGPPDLQVTLVLTEQRVKLDSPDFMEKLVIQVAKEKKVEEEKLVIKALKGMDHLDIQETRDPKVSEGVQVELSMVSLESLGKEVMWVDRGSGAMLVCAGPQGSASPLGVLL